MIELLDKIMVYSMSFLINGQVNIPKVIAKLTR